MREKLLLAVVVILGAMFATSRAQAPTGPEVGRFQLYDFAKNGGGAIYRMDTANGQTWALTVGKTPEGKSSLAWMRVPEDANPSIGQK